MTRIHGEVVIANNTRGNYFIEDERGTRYYGSQHNIVSLWGEHGLRILLKGWQVEFTPTKTTKGLQALTILPISTTIVTSQPNTTLSVSGDGVARLRIDPSGRVDAMDERPIQPHVELDGFRAFFTGHAPHLRTTEFTVPAPTAERAFVLLDNQKNPRRMRADSSFVAEPGFYLMLVERSGVVALWNLGRRIQGNSEHWLFIEERFRHTYDFTQEIEEQIVRQTPRSGLARDNHQFIPGIMRGLQYMKQAMATA